MKKTLLLSAIATVACAALVSSCAKPSGPEPEPPTPTLTYTLGASALTSFGELQTPYTLPAEQTVTVTNTGTGAVILSRLAATYYTVGSLSAINLAAGDTATFTVCPKPDLPPGPYNETIEIEGTGGAATSVEARFTVLPASSGNTTMEVIIFMRHYNDDRLLCVMKPDGNDVRVVATGSRGDLNRAGTHIVEGDVNIRVYDIAAKTWRTVLESEQWGPKYDEAVWSPDGRTILYISYASIYEDGEWSDQVRLESVGADGTGVRVLSEQYEFWWPNYTPDGRTIVCNGEGHLCTMSADGSNFREIASQGGDYPFPVSEKSFPISDTRVIYFSDGGLHACDIDGENHALLEEFDIDDTFDYPTASSDGKTIAYRQSSVVAESGLFVRTLEGNTLGPAVRLTDNGYRFRFGRIREDLFDELPSWQEPTETE